MSNPKEEFYRVLNEIVGTDRIDNEEAYIINDYVSRLEATHREEQKEIFRLNNIINELEKDLKQKIEEDKLNIISNSHWLYVLDKLKELKEGK